MFTMERHVKVFLTLQLLLPQDISEEERRIDI
jgi:hypothetical protein